MCAPHAASFPPAQTLCVESYHQLQVDAAWLAGGPLRSVGEDEQVLHGLLEELLGAAADRTVTPPVPLEPGQIRALVAKGVVAS